MRIQWDSRDKSREYPDQFQGYLSEKNQVMQAKNYAEKGSDLSHRIAQVLQWRTSKIHVLYANNYQENEQSRYTYLNI